MSHKLSIILYSYNMGINDRLSNCMEMLLSQTVGDYEILAIDDVSSDESEKILKEYETKNPEKVKVFVNEEKIGRGGARNVGLKTADGEWVGFIDGRDEIPDDYYEKLIETAVKNDADAAGCALDMFSEGVDEMTRESAGELDEEKRARLIINPGCMTTKVYKRSLFYDNGLWFTEENTWDEESISRLVMMYVKKYSFCEEVKYRRNTVEKWNSDTRLVFNCYERIDVMTYFIEECFKREFLEEYPEEIEEAYIERMYVDTLFEYMQGVKWFKRKPIFLKMLKSGIMECFPEFDTNPYYWEKYDDEVKSLIGKHINNPVKFMIGYKTPVSMK